MIYRTADNWIDGAVLTFADIDFQKKAQDILETTQASSMEKGDSS